jgi:hypothetical protein
VVAASARLETRLLEEGAQGRPARRSQATGRALNYLCRITAPHFCAGLIVSGKSLTVVEAAPILSYMFSWSGSHVRQYCDRRGWDLEIIYDRRPSPDPL